MEGKNKTFENSYLKTTGCKLSTSKIRKLVKMNWSEIRKTADFTVSAKGSFEIMDFGRDGDELVVEIYSKGYMYDITFTVSFDAEFTESCFLKGEVLDCYNYSRR
jgi:hypothetical protein